MPRHERFVFQHVAKHDDVRLMAEGILYMYFTTRQKSHLL